jgi:glucose/arabinose dehydrogenase
MMHPSLIPLLSLLIVYIYVSSGQDFLSLNSNNYGDAQGQKLSNERKLYGCETTGDAIHCDLVPNAWNSFTMRANESKVYPSIRDDIRYAEGKYDKALQLYDKNREFVEINGSSDFNSPKFSISFWIKQAPETGPYGHIVSYVNSNQTAGWFFDSTSTNASDPASNQTINFVIVNNTSGLYRMPVGITISPNFFSHVVGTFDGSIGRVYKDGILLEEFEFNGVYDSDLGLPMKIGSAAYCLSCNRWSGVIDDVRYYNRTLTENEVIDLFQNSPNDTIAIGDLAGYWNFNGDTQDHSGRGNNGNLFTLISSMAFAPDGRLFFSEKNTGKIRIMKDDKVLPTPFVQIYDHYVHWEQGLLGLAIDPKFELNKYVYLYYTYLDPERGEPYNRIMRFTEGANNTANPTATVLLDKIPASEGYHAGGALAFGPDDKLYVTVGDATQRIVSQNISLPLGKILRINRDGTIPADNPYPNSPVYTLGHRNAYGIAFDNNSKLGIVTENGDTLYDEINLIQKGGNYGYPTLQPVNRPPELSNSSSSIKPLRSYFSTIAPTQAIFYTGDKYPSLKGSFAFGTFTGSIFAIKLDVDTKQIVEEQHIRLGHYPFEAVIGIAQSPTGDIYFGAYNIYKISSVNTFDEKYDMFNVELSSSLDVNLLGIQKSDEVNKKEWKMTLEMNSNENENNPSSTSPDFVNLTLPSGAAQNVSSIRIEKDDNSSAVQQNMTDTLNQNYALDFTVDRRQGFLLVNIPIEPNIISNNPTKIVITVQSPRFSIF